MFDNALDLLSSKAIKDGQRHPCPAGHCDTGTAAGGQPWPALLPALLHICCPWSGAVWSIR